MTTATVAKTRRVRYSTWTWSYGALDTAALSRIDWPGVVKVRRLDRMPQTSWSPKRERQYEHIKESLEDRGTNEDEAEEIAARTVNKERARHRETKQASRTSIDDISSVPRGGLRSHKGSGGRTYDQLRNEARQRGIKGRSKMRKAQLEKILSR
jgi:plasmid stabilization system protein ParE